MPPLHPVVVHFPIALLVSAALVYLASLVIKGRKLEQVAFGLHVGGLLMTVAAIFTGDYAEHSTAMTHEMHEIIEDHEFLGMMSAYGFGILAVWAFLRSRSTLLLERIGFVVAFVGVTVMLGIAAHKGGTVVYEYGAGIEPMQPHLEQLRLEEQKNAKHKNDDDAHDDD